MSRNIKAWVEAEIHPDSVELAECFWAMDSEEQCAFFDHLAKISSGKIQSQLHACASSKHMTPEARAVMGVIGEYAEVRS